MSLEFAPRNPSTEPPRVARLLSEGGPSVVFQPVFELNSFLAGEERVVGMEALARFPDGGSPAEWFLRADREGAGLGLELAAIRRALEALPGLPPGAYLSVNASPGTMTSPRIVEVLGDREPGRVIVEVSEPQVMGRFEEVQEALFGFRALGLRLAVDDVGTGAVSLRSLVRLQPDVIKLDVGLTRDIDRDWERRALAAALAAFAGDMGAFVVAEGVERISQLETLLHLGVRYGQGYYLARPGRLSGA